MRFSNVLAVAVGLLVLGQEAYGSCTLRFTSPLNGATVRAANVTVFGQGGADVAQGDAGTVTATLNGAPFFNYSGSFTAAVTFLQSRGVGVSLRPGLNFLSVTGSAGGCSASDSMTVMYSPDIDLSKNKGKPGDTLSCSAPSRSQGNPIDIGIGNKYQEEVDYVSGGAYPLSFSRIYNSVDGYWRHSYSSRLRVAASVLTYIRADGRESRFTVNGNNAVGEPSELGRIIKNDSGWRYFSSTQEQLDFDSVGRLTRISNSLGQAHYLSYDLDVLTVLDDFGNELTIVQDDRGQPLSLNAPGTSVVYNYDSVSRLVNLEKTQSGVVQERIFHYENSSYPRFLTGITDERGMRYATWVYDGQGRTISSEHAGGAEKISLTYNSDGSTTVTNELGKKAVYRFQIIQGVKSISAIEGEPSANCPSSNSSFTYDSRGLLKTKTDNKGHITTYDYNERGLEISRTEASGTPQARTVLTDWHPEFFLPVTVTEPDRITTYSYDTQGRQRSQSVTERN